VTIDELFQPRKTRNGTLKSVSAIRAGKIKGYLGSSSCSTTMAGKAKVLSFLVRQFPITESRWPTISRALIHHNTFLYAVEHGLDSVLDIADNSPTGGQLGILRVASTLLEHVFLGPL